jgi:hypothetical protein
MSLQDDDAHCTPKLNKREERAIEKFDRPFG